jgi:DDE_Tnp_1-associated
MDPIMALPDHFAAVDDPRVERTKLHRLGDMLVITLYAVLAGASSWDDIALFGETHHAWLATFLAFPYGIPSHDTFNRVCAAVNPAQFEEAFRAWAQSLVAASDRIGWQNRPWIA